MAWTLYQPALLVSVERRDNADTGSSFFLEYAGTEAQMAELAAYYGLDGAGSPIGYSYKTHLIKRFGVPVGLTVEIPDSILYTERWSRTTEVVPMPVWTSPRFRLFDPLMSGLDLATAGGLATYLWRISQLEKATNIFRDGADYNDAFTVPAPALATSLGAINNEERQMIMDVARFGDQTERKRPVLRRHRAVPYASDSGAELFGEEQLYTTAELVAVFNIPASIAARLYTVADFLPDAPPNCLWGWKSRCDDVEVVTGSARFEETLDFVFDLWSTIRHISS